MPIIEPAKVATSPNATRSVSWICPCGSMSTPVKRSASPPMERTAAVISCMIRSFIYVIFEIRCKSTTKKRSHQILWLRLLTIDNFTASRTRKSPTIPPKATIRLSIFGSSTLCCADDGAYMYPPIRHKWF